MEFVPNSDHLLTLEQTADTLGKLSLTQTIYDPSTRTKLNETLIRLTSQRTCQAYDPTRTKLVVGSSDSTLLLSLGAGQVTRTTKTPFVSDP